MLRKTALDFHCLFEKLSVCTWLLFVIVCAVVYDCRVRFKVNVKLAIPDIVVEPALSEVQQAMALITRLIMDAPKGWC